MLQVKLAFQWYPRDDKNAHKSLGVIWIPSTTIIEPSRGITYEREGGYYAQTWMGNIQLSPGDWVISCISGNRYVIKRFDYERQLTERRSYIYNTAVLIKKWCFE